MNRRSFLLLGLFPLTSNSSTSPFPKPKYNIGDRVRLEWHERSTGWSGWEVGIVQGLIYDNRGSGDEWLYQIYVTESSYEESIGKTDEVFESEVLPP